MIPSGLAGNFGELKGDPLFKKEGLAGFHRIFEGQRGETAEHLVSRPSRIFY